MTRPRHRREQWFQFWGWMLFLLCALLFLWSGITAGDRILIAGSAVFLLACLVFLWPLVEELFRRTPDTERLDHERR